MKLMTNGSEQIARRTFIGAVGAALLLTLPSAALAGPGADLTAEATTTLTTLYAVDPKAEELGRRARAILVFPNIVKAGVFVGGHKGNGVLLVDGKAASYHSISAGSIGWQVGAQRYGYVMFLMTESAVTYMKARNGWSVGSGPSVVFLDKGVARSVNTTTLHEDIYAMAVSQRGLMAGTGLEGSKISEINLEP